MGISVVICAFTMDRWDTLMGAVRSCTEQTLPPDEIIVVIDYNEELRRRATEEFTGTRVVANQSVKGVSGARNTGVALASGDVIAFLDDDAYAEPKWLEQLTIPMMMDPTVAGVGGWILPHWPGTPPAWFPETFYWILGCSYAGLPENNQPIRNAIGANMAIRRQVFTSVGGFASGIGRVGLIPLGCEETELCIRYTARTPDERFVLARDAVVHQWVPPSRLTWRYFWTRCWGEGISKAAVSFLAGSETGLMAERQHVLRALPLELGQSLLVLPKHPRTAAVRSALIIAGTACTAAGLLWGRVTLRKTPIEFDRSELQHLIKAIRDEHGSSPSTIGEFSAPDHSSTIRAPSNVEPHDVRGPSDDVCAVTLVQFDIDQEQEPRMRAVAPGARVWVEVVKQGQIVGVEQKFADIEGLSVSVLQELKAKYCDAEVSSHRSIEDAILPSMSVVVPTIYRRKSELTRLVNSLLELDYPNFEIVVVDNRSGTDNDPISDLLGGARVRVVIEKTPGASAARNRGISATTGDIIAFTDDDTVVDVSWLREIGATFALDSEIDAVSGMVRPLELVTEPQVWFEEYFGGFTKTCSPKVWRVEQVGDSDKLFPYAAGRFGAGCNMAVRRSTIDRLGGFDPLLGGGTPARGAEDLALMLKVLFSGGSVAYEPAAMVRHGHRRTKREFDGQVFGFGVGMTAMFTDMIIRDPRHIVEIVRRVPAGLRLLVRPANPETSDLTTSYPRATPLRYLLGMVYGPFAYALSVMKLKKYR
jgi:glycosyltransferase involved in cell wall biosynthesis